MTAHDIIRLLDLKPHPEGGHFRETFRDAPAPGGRSTSTAIYYLLRAGETSRWHRVDAAEVWHFYAGDPLELLLSPGGVAVEHQVLGPDLAKGERPQLVVPARVWQSAKPLGAFALVGCTVAPGFEFKGFEMAPSGWTPGPPR
jgi:predicted cupin superfamily sugar epimerase